MQSKNLPRTLNRTETAIILAAVMLVPLFHWPWIGGGDPFTLAKTVLLAVLTGLFAIVRAVRIAKVPAVEPRAMGISVLSILAIFWGLSSLLSLLANPYPGHFFHVSLLQWLFIAWIFLLSGLASPRDILKPLIVIIVASGSVVALIGLVQVLAPKAISWLLPYSGSAGDVRHVVFSTVGNPEYLGGYLAGVLVLTFGLMLRTRRWFLWALLLAGAFVQMVALMRTGARGAWLGALAGLAVIALVEFKRRHSIARILSAGAILLMLAGTLLYLFSTANPLNPYRANFLKRLQELRDPRSESVRHRLALLLAGTAMIRQHPVLGVGPGHFPHDFYLQIDRMEAADETGAMADYLKLLKGRNPDHAHNDPIEIWAETGTLGFAAFLGLIAWGLAAMIRAVFKPGESAALIALCLAFSAAILVESLFSFPLHLPTRGLLFWTLLAVGSVAALHGATIEDQGHAHADSLPAERV